MENVKYLTSLDEIKAFSDPYRMIIMKNYYILAKPATVKQIADKMNEVPAKVHYHVKKLESVGILKLNHTKEINGIVAKFYEPTAKSFQIQNSEIGDFTFNNKMNAVQSEASDTYDKSKRVFINTLTDNEDDVLNHIAMNKVKLTEAEYYEIIDFIQAKVNRKKAMDETSELKSFHVFTSIVESN